LSNLLNNQTDQLFDERTLAVQLEKFINDIRDFENNNTGAIQIDNVSSFADSGFDSNDGFGRSEIHSHADDSIMSSSEIKKETVDGSRSMSSNEALFSVNHNHTYLETIRDNEVEEIYHPHSYKNKIKNIMSLNDRISKDEQLLNDYRISYTLDTIVNSEVDDFNEILKDEDLTADQISVIKDIRKRGKNKVSLGYLVSEIFILLVQTEIHFQIFSSSRNIWIAWNENSRLRQ
jgi:hypothetical protein